MKTNHKALLLVLCAVALVAGSVFGTLAYLTDTDAATNTFTVGSVHIKLDEFEVNPDGTKKSDLRVHENEYHLLPGHTYLKDPTVTVKAGSSDAYIRMLVKVENIEKLMAALPDESYYGADGVFLLQNLVQGWDNDTWNYHGYTKEDGTGIYEFRYKEIVKQKPDAKDAVKLQYLFKYITVPGELDNDHLAYLKDVKINVVAHAIQADGFKDANAAWAAF